MWRSSPAPGVCPRELKMHPRKDLLLSVYSSVPYHSENVETTRASSADARAKGLCRLHAWDVTQP